MTSLDFKREQVGEYGGITGLGASRTLGAPHLPLLDIVVREAVQNSWDARLDSSGIDFGVMAFTFSDAQLRALKKVLAAGIGGPQGLALPEDLDGLVIYDRGTRGLGGAIEPGSPDAADFARFVYMIGETKPGEAGVSAGGTYGFGRSSFFRASALSTILVHTSIRSGGGRTSRLVGMMWRDSYDHGRQRYTGRHWWGRSKKGWTGPAEGPEADAIAASVGLPVASESTGTSILVLAPRWSSVSGDDDESEELGELEQRQRARAIVEECLLWNCWPRLRDHSVRTMLNWFGERSELPEPARHARIKHFVAALEAASGGSGRAVRRTIESKRPQQVLGALGLNMVPFVAGTRKEGDELRDPSRPLHHVALMRSTRLVVRYLESTEPPDALQYAGVFLADPEVDPVFARSEPPSHDDWVQERLEHRHERTFVNVAIRRIKESCKEFAAPALVGEGQAVEGLAMVADELGHLLPTTDGGRPGPRAGASGRGGGGAGTRGRRRPHVELRAPVRSVQGRALRIRLPFSVSASEAPTIHLSAAAVVVTDGGGSEKEIPAGMSVPRVLSWDIEGRTSAGDAVTVDGRSGVEGHVIVEQPPDVEVRISVEAEES